MNKGRTLEDSWFFDHNSQYPGTTEEQFRRGTQNPKCPPERSCTIAAALCQSRSPDDEPHGETLVFFKINSASEGVQPDQPGKPIVSDMLCFCTFLPWEF